MPKPTAKHMELSKELHSKPKKLILVPKKDASKKSFFYFESKDISRVEFKAENKKTKLGELHSAELTLFNGERKPVSVLVFKDSRQIKRFIYDCQKKLEYLSRLGIQLPKIGFTRHLDSKNQFNILFIFESKGSNQNLVESILSSKTEQEVNNLINNWSQLIRRNLSPEHFLISKSGALELKDVYSFFTSDFRKFSFDGFLDNLLNLIDNFNYNSTRQNYSERLHSILEIKYFLTKFSETLSKDKYALLLQKLKFKWYKLKDFFPESYFPDPKYSLFR